MTRIFRLSLLLFYFGALTAQAQTPWTPAPLRLQTRWSKLVSPANALPEYPRPQMVRPGWTNLNGLWQYAITDSAAAAPDRYNGQMLVPYPLESALSGVGKRLGTAQALWYQRVVRVSRNPRQRTLLHFGAVDQQATVYVNGHEVGRHAGGYTAFSFDITTALHDGDDTIVVKVLDPTDQGVYPHGKQVTNPANIYYTPSSGIWQTVWLEVVPNAYISALRILPDVDDRSVAVTVDAPAGYLVRVIATDQGRAVSTVNGHAQTKVRLPLYDPKLWSPAHPFLYDLTVQLLKEKKIIDEVSSYFGMRKVSVGKDSAGFYRIFLNNQYVYNLGVLDQGFWPDGLYTAPTDEALAFDIQAIKAMGFNTIRKHIKLEPARWYYHADKLGMLVWQDFVNPVQTLPEGAKAAFEQQLHETMDQLYNHPCISTWVLFNEKWGQYEQQRLTDAVRQRDPSRLLNAHSGEMLWVNDQLRSPSPDAWVHSQLADVHSYPYPRNAPAKEGRVQILGEFGGIGVFIPDHQWLSNKSWGYVQVTPAQLAGKYAIMNEELQLLEKEGLAGSIYTQPFDVEGEENGLMTYDRAVIKIPFDTLRGIHAHLNPSMGPVPQVTAENADLTDPGMRYSRLLQRYIDGERDPGFLKQAAMLAAQVGDQAGAQRIGSDYVAGLHLPLGDEDIPLVAQFTTSTHDPGARLMTQDTAAFRRVLGERPYTVKLMNLVYEGEMKPLIENHPSPDWDVIAGKVQPYGAAGEEILLRAKTIHFLNAQDWKNYVPVAKEYLQKYAAYIRDNEKQMFQEAIEEHSK
jgi:hypothetical protein